ncbi:MAG: YdcF family protein [Clostridia bacterium]|nr:YdcF family protein [Clostridia bacterium]
MKKKVKKILKITAVVFLCLSIIGIIALTAISRHIVSRTRSRIISPEEAARLQDIDCIIVLGCGVRPDNTPSHMLEDRLKTGIALFESNAAPKLLMSGDHGRKDYDEVNVMKNFAMKNGIASSDIFMDHAGFSSYETIYRAKEIFKVKRAIIVTQEYHLYRTLYLAEALGLEAYGVSADLRTYRGQFERDLRELLARSKDFISAKTKPEPKYLGESIPINGDGDITNG